MKAAANPWLQPGVVGYLTLGGCALAALGLVLVDRGFGLYAALPVAAGIVAAPTRLGPAALVVTLAVCLNALPHDTDSLWEKTLSVPDLILCGAVLGYTAAFHRLQAIRRWVFPAGSIPGRPPRSVARPRAAGLATHAELSALVMALPAAALVASLAWAALPRLPAAGDSLNLVMPAPPRDDVPDLPTEVWQAVVLTLVSGVGALITAAAFDYAGRRSMTTEEAELLLQDSLWHETGGDQRRVSRWLAWARVRRKEGP